MRPAETRDKLQRWSKRHQHSRSCCVMLYRATFVGRGRYWLSEHAWLSVEQSCDVTNMLRRASQTKKKRI